MTSVKYSVYSLDCGLFHSCIETSIMDNLRCMVKDGFGCIIGGYDALSQRVDIATGMVIDYQPDQPSVNHVWDVGSKRWLYVKTDEDIAAEVRAQRDKLISACDWVTVRALDQGGAVPAEWAAYRSALRDVSRQSGFPRLITWPVAPSL